MRYAKLFLFLTSVLTIFALPTLGQDHPPLQDGPGGQRQEGRRPNLLAELGLSPEQVQQIRRMNQQRRPAMMEAQRRMREANRALDISIYGESVSDLEFQSRLKEFQAAQAEMVRLRFENELSVRKVLTPEQLVRFRELRQRFAEARDTRFPNRRMRRGGDGPGPARDAAPKRPIN